MLTKKRNIRKVIVFVISQMSFSTCLFPAAAGVPQMTAVVQAPTAQDVFNVIQARQLPRLIRWIETDIISPNEQLESGETLLTAAIKLETEDNVSVVTELLNLSANPHLMNAHGEAPLALAVTQGKHSIARTLIRSIEGLLIPKISHKGVPQMAMVGEDLARIIIDELVRGQTLRINQLIEFGIICPDALLPNGDTLLTAAIKLNVEGNPSVVMELLGLGANPNFVNKRGCEKPLDLAALRGKRQILQALQAAAELRQSKPEPISNDAIQPLPRRRRI